MPSAESAKSRAGTVPQAVEQAAGVNHEDAQRIAKKAAAAPVVVHNRSRVNVHEASCSKTRDAGCTCKRTPPTELSSGLKLAVCVVGFAHKGIEGIRIIDAPAYQRFANVNMEMRELGAGRVDVFFNLDLNIYEQSRTGLQVVAGKLQCPRPPCGEQTGANTSNMRVIGQTSMNSLLPVINTVRPVSVEFSGSTFCQTSRLCSPSCSAVGGRMPQRMWEQYARVSRVFHQVLAYEREHNIEYTWIAKLRSDFISSIYWSSVVVAHASAHPSAVLASGNGAPGYGQIDLAALVPRSLAVAYYELPQTSCAWLSCVNDVYRDRSHDIKNERLLAEFIYSQGAALGHICQAGNAPVAGNQLQATKVCAHCVYNESCTRPPVPPPPPPPRSYPPSPLPPSYPADHPMRHRRHRTQPSP